MGSDAEQPGMEPPRGGSPLDPRRRIVVLDVVRGVAVLGILIVNAAFFALPDAWAEDPLTQGPHGGADLWAWSLVQVFAQGKFISLFSILFGAGVWLMADRADATGRSAASVHYRRSLWLLAIGMVHAYGVWSGDILVSYSLVGMLVFLLRDAPVQMQAVVGAAALLVGGVLQLTCFGSFWAAFAFAPAGTEGLEIYAQEDIDAELDAMRGGPVEQLAFRAGETAYAQAMSLLLYGPWYVAMMLLGMILVRTGVLTGERPGRFYAAAAAAALGVGLPATAAVQAWCVANPENVGGRYFFAYQIDYWVGPWIGLGYAALLVLLVRSGLAAGVVRALAAAGRMALTNYLLQSLIFTSVFYGHGLGLFGGVGLARVMLLVVAVWVFELWLSVWWLGRFRFGPMEWVWRSLTYGRVQGMRKAEG